ncbi:MAG: hypothetical protein QXF24_09320 [Thermoproteota archaeon]
MISLMDVLDFLSLLDLTMGVLIVVILVVGAYEIVTRRKKKE